MRRGLRLLRAIFVSSLQRDLTYRAELVADATFTALTTAGTLVTLAAVYRYVGQLAGRSPGEAVVIVGTFLVVNGLLLAFVEPNLELFATTQILRGGLDEILLKPASSLFLASLGKARPRALVDVVVGVGVAAVGAGMDDGVSAAGVGLWLLLVGVGFAVAWSLRVLLAVGAFWAPGLETGVFFLSLWQLGRFPVSVYAPWLRILLTYALPLALVASVPARAMTGHVSLIVMFGAGAVAAACVLVVRLAWGAGLRRYTSATS
jgi:ABC-2 type transport system permease protein